MATTTGNNDMRAYSQQDFEANPKKYELFKTAIVRSHLFTNDGEQDIEAGTVVAIAYRCTARNQLHKRSEPVYWIGGYDTPIYANCLSDFVL
jgi:hypothetical protein